MHTYTLQQPGALPKQYKDTPYVKAWQDLAVFVQAVQKTLITAVFEPEDIKLQHLQGPITKAVLGSALGKAAWPSAVPRVNTRVGFSLCCHGLSRASNSMDGACTHCYGNSTQVLALWPSPGTCNWTRKRNSELYRTEISLHVCLPKLGLALARPLWKICRSGQISVKLFIPWLATMQLKAQLKCTTTFSATQADFTVYFTFRTTSKKGFYFLVFIPSIKFYYNGSLWKIMKKLAFTFLLQLLWSYWIYMLCVVTFWKTRKHHR